MKLSKQMNVICRTDNEEFATERLILFIDTPSVENVLDIELTTNGLNAELTGGNTAHGTVWRKNSVSVTLRIYKYVEKYQKVMEDDSRYSKFVKNTIEDELASIVYLSVIDILWELNISRDEDSSTMSCLRNACRQVAESFLENEAPIYPRDESEPQPSKDFTTEVKEHDRDNKPTADNNEFDTLSTFCYKVLDSKIGQLVNFGISSLVKDPTDSTYAQKYDERLEKAIEAAEVDESHRSVLRKCMSHLADVDRNCLKDQVQAMWLTLIMGASTDGFTSIASPRMMEGYITGKYYRLLYHKGINSLIRLAEKDFGKKFGRSDKIKLRSCLCISMEMMLIDSLTEPGVLDIFNGILYVCRDDHIDAATED